MQVPHVVASDQARRRSLSWEPGSVITLLLGGIALVYASWVLLGGSEGQATDTRHLLDLITFLPVSGASVLLAGRTRRLPTLERRARRGWTLLWLALLVNWLGGTLYTVL